MSSPILPQPLPAGIDPGPQPAAASAAESGVVRLTAKVLAITRGGALVATGRGQLVLEGAPALRPQTALTLELRTTGDTRAGRLLAAGRERFDPPVPVRAQPAASPAPAVVRSSPGIEVSLRPIGPDGRPSAPAFTARLVVPPTPSPAGSPLVSSPTPSAPPVPSPGGAPAPNPALGSPAAASGVPASGPTSAPAPLPVPPGAPALSTPPTSLSAAQPKPLAPASAGSPGVLQAAVAPADPRQGAALPGRPIEVVAVRRDALGRFLLKGAGLTLHVETPVELPPGARLVLALPVGRPLGHPLPGSIAGPTAREQAPLEAVRQLVEALPDAPDEQAAAPRLPGPTATLAARLLRLVQVLGSPPAGSTAGTDMAEAAEPQAVGARIGAALTELGRVAAEPQNGWRLFLLPLGFEGTPALRLYVRDDPEEERGAGRDRGSSDARRAIFELEFSHLGRCQVDALCQERRFDLIVRTERPLPPDLQADVRALFVAARDAAGQGGELGFRAAEWVVLPDPEARAGGRADAITV